MFTVFLSAILKYIVGCQSSMYIVFQMLVQASSSYTSKVLIGALGTTVSHKESVGIMGKAC